MASSNYKMGEFQKKPSQSDTQIPLYPVEKEDK